MRIAISKYRNIALVGALTVGMVLTGIVYAQLNQKDAKQSVASKNRENGVSAVDSHGPGSKSLSMNKEARRKGFNDSVKNGWNSFSVPADTSPSLSFKLKYPKLGALGQPYGIYVDKYAPKDDRTAYIYYGDPADGIEVSAHKLPKVDFQAQVREAQENKKADILKADSTPFLIEVNGFRGEAAEPGYNVINDNKEPRPGFVTWQEDDGVIYTVYGTYGPQGTSVKELLEIARSVSE